MAETCGGYCCEKFRFRYNETPEILNAEALRLGGDAKMIAEMVIYLGESDTDVDGDKGEVTHWYTCKYFDTVTRLCKTYETRPKMCRDFNSKPWNRCGIRKCQMPKPEWPHDSEAQGAIKKKEEISEPSHRPAPHDRAVVLGRRADPSDGAESAAGAGSSLGLSARP